MTVVFCCPRHALPSVNDPTLERAVQILGGAGWHVVLSHSGGISPEMAMRQAKKQGADLLLIGPGDEVCTPGVLACLGSAGAAPSPLDVVYCVPDPLAVLLHHWTATVDCGGTAPLDQVLRALLDRPETVPELLPHAALKPLIGAPGITLHAVPMLHLQCCPLTHLFGDILGIDGIPDADVFQSVRGMKKTAKTLSDPGTAATMMDSTSTSIRFSEALRLLSTCMFRDLGVVSEKERAARLRMLPEADVSALADLIASDAGIARRSFEFSLPIDIVRGLGGLASDLAGSWTIDAGTPAKLSDCSIELTHYDGDAALSFGRIADAVADIIGATRGGQDIKTQAKVAKPEIHARTPGAVVPSENERPKILVLGHSHIGALDLAWKAGHACQNDLMYRSAHLNTAALQPNFETGKGRRRISKSFQASLETLIRREAPDLVVALPMGNEYNAVAMTSIGPEFGFVWPDEPARTEMDVWQVPFAMMRAQIAALAGRNALLMFAAIAKAADCPVIALPPPPPVFDEGHIRANPGRFADAIDQAGLNPPALRARIWRLYIQILAEELERLDIKLMRLPEQVFDHHDGEPYLHSTMRADDPTHANAAYGSHILAALARQARAPALCAA